MRVRARRPLHKGGLSVIAGLLLVVIFDFAGGHGLAGAINGSKIQHHPPYLLGTWETVAVTNKGRSYPQKWVITKEDFRLQSDGGGGFSGTDDGFKLTGSKADKGDVLNTVSVDGPYTSYGSFRVHLGSSGPSVAPITMTGRFVDSNHSIGTFTGTLVRPGPDRPPVSGKLTVIFGGTNGKQYGSYEYYVTPGTQLRVCNHSTILTAPYMVQSALDRLFLHPGQCTEFVSVGTKPGIFYLYDADHSLVYSYIVVS